MTIDFYFSRQSPPCHTVMMLGKALGIHFNFIPVILVLEVEHIKYKFSKNNPQHVIPMIDDNGFIMCESRAIMIYLVSRYARNDRFYPKDLKKKGIVDQRLYFDICSLYDYFMKCYITVDPGLKETVKEANVQDLEKIMETLNIFLQDSRFVAGNEVTVADFSIITSVSSLMEYGFDIGRYENVSDWYKKCSRELEKYGFREINLSGLKFTGKLNS